MQRALALGLLSMVLAVLVGIPMAIILSFDVRWTLEMAERRPVEGAVGFVVVLGLCYALWSASGNDN